MEEELQKKLLSKAADLLARRSYSCGEMRAKLAKLADPSDVEGALKRLMALNLLNDADYAYNFAFSRLRQQGWGSIKVRLSLIHRQIAPQVIEAAIDRVRQEVGEGVTLREYLDRHCRKTGLPSDRKSIRRLINHLRRRGFVDAAIYSTLRQVIPETSWECFETGE
jgi:SOS response regulatory protein OraA/RecX